MKINKESGEKMAAVLKKNKYVLIVILAGIILLLLPTDGWLSGGREAGTDGSGTDVSEFSLSEQEKRISEALSKIDGAGEVTVVLTLKSSAEQVLASDRRSSGKTTKGDMGEENAENSETTVIITTGSQQQSPVRLKYIYPEYLGALVVAEGAENPAVRLELLNAIAGLTGLGTDKITVTKMNISLGG